MPRLLRRKRPTEDTPVPDPIPVDPAAEEDGETVFVPFVPVERTHDYEDEESSSESESATVAPPPEKHRRIPRIERPQVPRPAIQVHMGMLLSVVFLFGMGIFGTLLNRDRLSDDAAAWWPAAIIGCGLLWMIMALAQRRVASFLGGSAFTGLGVSLLMDTQDIAQFQETVMGVLLVMVGLGIIIRGFLLRGRVVA
jgi:hypothetical protein